MVKSILLIGLGKFGKNIAMQLNRLGHEVMAVDKSEERVNEVMPYVTDAQIGDSTNEEFLRGLGIGNYDVCIVAIGNDFQSSLETTYALKEMGAKLVTARAEQDGQEKLLLRNGADEVMYPEKKMAKWAAIRYSSEHILDYIEVDEKLSVFEVSTPEEWWGKTVGQLDIRKRYQVTILALKKGNDISVSITPETTLSADKTLLVLGEFKTLQKCFHV